MLTAARLTVENSGFIQTYAKCGSETGSALNAKHKDADKLRHVFAVLSANSGTSFIRGVPAGLQVRVPNHHRQRSTAARRIDLNSRDAIQHRLLLTRGAGDYNDERFLAHNKWRADDRRSSSRVRAVVSLHVVPRSRYGHPSDDVKFGLCGVAVLAVGAVR